MSEIENNLSNSSIINNQKKGQNLTRYEKLDIPGKIQINNYFYTYKDQSRADKNVFFYRCCKNNCKIIIEINREN